MKLLRGGRKRLFKKSKALPLVKSAVESVDSKSRMDQG